MALNADRHWTAPYFHSADRGTGYFFGRIFQHFHKEITRRFGIINRPVMLGELDVKLLQSVFSLWF